MIKLKEHFNIQEEINDGKCPRLEDWIRVFPDKTLFDTRIAGTVYDHPKFDDGTLIRTSPVVSMGYSWAQTQNTFYVLGRKYSHG